MYDHIIYELDFPFGNNSNNDNNKLSAKGMKFYCQCMHA